MRLTGAAILAAKDLKQADVDCPEWGGMVTVRELSVSERAALALIAKEDAGRIAPWLVATAAIDDAGAPLFPAEDREAAIAGLSARAASPVERLAAEVMRLSGMAIDPEAAAGN